MTVSKHSIPNKKSSTKKNKSNLSKKINTLLNLSLNKEKPCKRKSTNFPKKNPKQKNKSSLLHIKNNKSPISPNKKTKNSLLSKIKSPNLPKKLKKSNKPVAPKSPNSKISSWKKSSTIKRKLLSISKKINSSPKRTNNQKNSPKISPKPMNKKYKL